MADKYVKPIIVRVEISKSCIITATKQGGVLDVDSGWLSDCRRTGSWDERWQQIQNVDF
jgi:hypothetical protein